MMGFYENLEKLPDDLYYVSAHAVIRWGFKGWLEALPVLIEKFYYACPKCLTDLDFTPFMQPEDDKKLFVCENGHWGSMAERLSIDFFISHLLRPIVDAITMRRHEYRRNKDFKEADRLREECHKLCFDIEDTRDSYRIDRYKVNHHVIRWEDKSNKQIPTVSKDKFVELIHGGK